MEELQDHPFINNYMKGQPLTQLNIKQFEESLKGTADFNPQHLVMADPKGTTPSGGDDTWSIVYSSKNADQLKILVDILIRSSQFNPEIDLTNSTYFASQDYKPDHMSTQI